MTQLLQQAFNQISQLPIETQNEIARQLLRQTAFSKQGSYSKTVDEVFGKLHKPNQKAISIDEMNQAIAKRFESFI